MPTRKIADIKEPCRSPDHNPPTHMFFPDGVYEHVCSSCGAKMVFTVVNPTLGSWVSSTGNRINYGSL